MSLVVHVRSSAGRWRSPRLDDLDATLRRCGSVELCLPWSRLAVASDGLHLTKAAQVKFEHHFSEGLRRLLRRRRFEARGKALTVLTDSTVGAHDFHAGAWTGAASRRLARALTRALGVASCRVDAVRGSGFVAHGEGNATFRRRLLLSGGADVVVLMGGWNDTECAQGVLREAARGCARAAAASRPVRINPRTPRAPAGATGSGSA